MREERGSEASLRAVRECGRVCERGCRRVMQPSNRGKTLSALQVVTTAWKEEWQWQMRRTTTVHRLCRMSVCEQVLYPRTWPLSPLSPPARCIQRGHDAPAVSMPTLPNIRLIYTLSSQNGHPIAISGQRLVAGSTVPRLSASVRHSVHPCQRVPVLGGLLRVTYPQRCVLSTKPAVAVLWERPHDARPRGLAPYVSLRYILPGSSPSAHPSSALQTRSHRIAHHPCAVAPLLHSVPSSLDVQTSRLSFLNRDSSFSSGAPPGPTVGASSAHVYVCCAQPLDARTIDRRAVFTHMLLRSQVSVLSYHAE